MDLGSTSQLILEYRYWILVPLSILEGPIAAFVAGTLASAGYFNIYALGVFFFARDMIMDALYYALGHYGGRTTLVQRILRKIGVRPDHLEEVRVLWERHAGKTMFLGKLSYGIASSFIVVAGMVKMPLRKFFGWGAIVAIVQFGTLLLTGYFFGASLGGGATHIIENIQYTIIGITTLITLFYFGSRYAKRKLLAESEEK